MTLYFLSPKCRDACNASARKSYILTYALWLNALTCALWLNVLTSYPAGPLRGPAGCVGDDIGLRCAGKDIGMLADALHASLHIGCILWHLLNVLPSCFAMYYLIALIKRNYMLALLPV